MKDLPDDPPVWTPPAARWFERYVPPAEDMAANTVRSLCAMWLMLLDRLGEPIPEKPRMFAPNERHLFAAHFRRIGADALMPAWRAECARLLPGTDPKKAFLTLLSKESLDGK